jgi:acyl-coenzyme A synthetase/AMP-(fatty) acid ligase
VCHEHYHANEKDRNAIILHSSGTTGLPKAIYQSQEYVLGYAANHCLSPEEAQGVNVSTLPLFHVSKSQRVVRLLNVADH